MFMWFLKVPVVDTEVDPPQQNSISPVNDDEPKKALLNIQQGLAKAINSGLNLAS